MGSGQVLCLALMFGVGFISCPFLEGWSEKTKSQQRLLIAWLAFWMAPPLYFVWTKGVMG